MRRHVLTLLLLVPLAGCGDADGDPGSDRAGEAVREALPTDTSPGLATAVGSGDATLPIDDIERGRLDDSWRSFADARTRGAGTGAEPGSGTDADTSSTASGAEGESLDDLVGDTVSADDVRTPVHGDVEGPSVLAVQILLDRALYRPGVVDGRWGKNTEKAVYWMQHAEGLEPTGRVDDRTLERLRELAGEPGPLVVERELTAADVEGRFVDIPDDVYEKAELDCLCYESLGEQLAERFHATRGLLERLNPGIDLDGVEAGDRLRVPDVGPFDADPDAAGGGAASGRTPSGDVAEIVVSDGGHYVHALDAAGDLLYHFPSTLGSEYAPSPEGDWEVDSIHRDPEWHYKPDLLTGVDPSKPDAMLPAGPNNAVGVVWMQLSKPHYGIHGTSAPETIGYATSHGCIRLTNWDADLLSRQVEAGTPVRFIDGARRAVAEG